MAADRGDRKRGRRAPRHLGDQRGPRRHRLHDRSSGMDLLEQGPGPGPSYSETKDGHDWSHSTGRAMAQNLIGVARALKAQPLNVPPS